MDINSCRFINKLSEDVVPITGAKRRVEKPRQSVKLDREKICIAIPQTKNDLTRIATSQAALSSYHTESACNGGSASQKNPLYLCAGHETEQNGAEQSKSASNTSTAAAERWKKMYMPQLSRAVSHASICTGALPLIALSVSASSRCQCACCAPLSQT